MSKTIIAWADHSWNPCTGCDPVSMACIDPAGRAGCYARYTCGWLHRVGQEKYRNNFKFTTHPYALAEPGKRKKPTIYFVNSVSDTFHEKAPLEFIQEIFRAMNSSPQHRFLVLTKRVERMLQLDSQLPWAPHIWAGVTVEHPDYLHRLELLRQVSSPTRFISMEPLLAPMPQLDLSGVSMVIVGCEKTPGTKRPGRPMEEEWVRQLRDMCLEQGVAFFYKQGVRNGKVVETPELDGQKWVQMPEGIVLEKNQG
ncbi:DUF5131 family protein [Candidatus Fermentibacterales bacterium]|nr:DUF5131 family protein [Candidatus Fermentibacterales bacterium]